MGIWWVVERVLLTLWVGGMWILGFLVAPTLFAVLESRHTAGMLVGGLLSLISHLGLVCGVVLLVGLLVQAGSRTFKHWRIWVLISMLLFLVIGEYGLAPQMIKLRNIAGEEIHEGSQEHYQFAILHGVASGLYFLNCLLGMVLVLSGLQRRLPSRS